ncbi:MAG TPA: TPM domain-containing protein [Chthoniobacterales bacterium]|jgi:Predicted membrane protein|nr:TPM domain-containing protein [Chthoniobacterales bacterium]
MRTKEFLSKLEHDAIVQAIRDAEAKTSGEIRVFIQRGEVKGDPLHAAQKRFHRLGLHKNAHHNDVLIWVAPRAHKFAVVGDEAIHQKCGDALWQSLIEKMRKHFRDENFTHALVDAIHAIGDALAEHFPRGSTSHGGAPNEVIEG